MRAFVMCGVLLGCAHGGVDYAMKVNQATGSAKIVRSALLLVPHVPHRHTAHPAQAANAGNFDLAAEKIGMIQTLLGQWRSALMAAKTESLKPEAPVATPPAESVEFSSTATHTPEKCKIKSVGGSTMKVHYVGKLISNGQIFASSFHTGSQPLKFKLGSDEVIEGWNKGLGDMCAGERRRLMVPYAMGYGEKGTKGVPPYSDLQYDFELVEMSLPRVGGGKREL